MKYLILLSFLFFSCNTQKSKITPEVIKDPVIAIHQCPEPIIIRDTIFLTKEYDSLQVVIKKKNDSLFVERYRLERVKYYNGIAQRNSSQRKFLVGWINRAVK
jgi:hypothetical protein